MTTWFLQLIYGVSAGFKLCATVGWSIISGSDHCKIVMASDGISKWQMTIKGAIFTDTFEVGKH